MKHLGLGFVMTDNKQLELDLLWQQYYSEERKRRKKMNRTFNIVRLGVAVLTSGLALAVVNKLDQSIKE